MSLLSKLLSNEQQPKRDGTGGEWRGPVAHVCPCGVTWWTWTRGDEPAAEFHCGAWLDEYQPGLLPDRVRIDGVRLRYAHDYFPEDHDHARVEHPAEHCCGAGEAAS